MERGLGLHDSSPRKKFRGLLRLLGGTSFFAGWTTIFAGAVGEIMLPSHRGAMPVWVVGLPMCDKCGHDEECVCRSPWAFVVPLPGMTRYATYELESLVDMYHTALTRVKREPSGHWLRVGDLRSRRDLREFLELFAAPPEGRAKPQWPPYSKDVDFAAFAPVARPILDTPETSVQLGGSSLPTSPLHVVLEGEDEDSVATRIRVSAAALHEHADIRRKVFEALIRLRVPKMAMRYAQCCSSGTVLRHFSPDGSDHYSLALSRCRSRFCPHCARIRASRLSARIAPVINAMRAPKMITLTLRQREGEFLNDTISRLHQSWRRLLRRDSWRSRVSGGVAILECKRGRDGWNAHYHVVAEAKYWPARDLSAIWEDCTGDSPIVDIRRIGRDDLARYLAKYVAKPFAGVPDEYLSELIYCLHGKRMLNKFGYLSKFPGLSEDALEADPSHDDVVVVCSFAVLVARAQKGDKAARKIFQAVFAKPDPASRDGTSREYQPDLFG